MSATYWCEKHGAHEGPMCRLCMRKSMAGQQTSQTPIQEHIRSQDAQIVSGQTEGTAGATLVIVDSLSGFNALIATIPVADKASEASTTETDMDEQQQWEAEQNRLQDADDERQQQDSDEHTMHDAATTYLARAFKACPPTVLEAASIAWVCEVQAPLAMAEMDRPQPSVFIIHAKGVT